MSRTTATGLHFPAPLTSFVGRGAELADLRRLVAANRLVTLTGSGGVGKTRLALQLTNDLATSFAGGLWWVDLASTTDAELVTERVAHTLGRLKHVTDRTVDALVRFIGDRHALIVLDNCEHLLSACTPLVAALLGGCARLQILTTSREPLGVAGEATWPTPALSLTDEALELFTQRARLVRPDFVVTDGTNGFVAEICRRLDGVPLAIELAATRVRLLSLAEIADGLQDRFGLLTDGPRTAVPRQQTLRASVDWSHALLSEPEQVVFRRLAVFSGGFDLAAAQAVGSDAELPRAQIVDELALLVEKSLLLADNAGHTTRYRMLETIHQYALEKLGESGETDATRTRHRDHYAGLFERQASAGYRWRIEQADSEIDNIRAALTWSVQRGELERAARLTWSLLPLWLHSRTLEGVSWLNRVLADRGTLPPAAKARALADKTIFEAVSGEYYHVDQAEQTLAIARDVDDPGLLAWALAAYGFTCCYSPEVALPYLQQAIELAPAMDDDWRLSQIYGVQAYSAFNAGDLATTRSAAEKGQQLGAAIGDWSVERLCRLFIGLVHLWHGDLTAVATQAKHLVAESDSEYDPLSRTQSLILLAEALAYQGDTGGARAAAAASVEAALDLIGFHRAVSLGAMADVTLAAGDIPAAVAASDALCDACALPQLLATIGNPVARATLASGDAAAARRSMDEVLSVTSGAHRALLLELSTRVAIAEADVERAERDAHQALAIATETGTFLTVPDVIECLATLDTNSGHYREAAKLFGAAAGIRERTGTVRYKIYAADYDATVADLREILAQTDFDKLWAEGTSLSTAEAIGYARRDRGAGSRPSSGWDALTPAERDVARLISEGLRNKEVAAKLFISVRTVESHLSHIYAKLELSSRVQLAQEATRRSRPE